MTELTYESFISLIKSIQINLPKFEMPKLRIGDLVARVPIVQGGMGVGISLSGLASSVAENGGIGVIAANGVGMIEADYFKDGRAANIRALRKEIRKARSRTKGIIGVNIMVALNDFHELLLTAIEERVDLIIMGAGLPIKNIPVDEIRKNNIKVAPIVSSQRAADLIFKMWKRIYKDVPDAIVVEGPEAGGHLGVPEDEIGDPAYRIEKVVPEVRETVAPYQEEFQREIPVIAAGGIFTGEDIYNIMKSGAQAVQMGTRFVATEECDADRAFKEAYVNARKEDIGIIKSPVGLPGRAILNEFLEQASGEKQPFKCPWQCLAGCQADEANYCISIALNNARKGRLSRGFAFVGSNAYRVKAIVPTAELMEELRAGYLQTLFNDMKERAAEVISRIRQLREEYLSAEERFRVAKNAYERNLAAKIENTRKESISALRQEYKKASAQLTELRLKLTERIYETYHELMDGQRPTDLLADR
ncbi:MAG TPA: nitronate monooxygenase [Sediminispirochaeta sp.]|nr:nitronate monooxygenase [Sediminispirochaeta sp.]